MELSHQPITEPVIGKQQRHKAEFGVHPALLEPAGLGDEQTDSHGYSHHHSRGCDDVRQATFHQGVLLLKRLLQLLVKIIGFHVIDEQPHQIEQACKPNHYAHNVEGLEPQVRLGGQGDHGCVSSG